MWKYLCILSLFTIACGKPSYVVHPKIQPYVSMFVEYSYYLNKYTPITDLRADFGDLDSTTLGICDYNTTTITLDKTYWKTANEYARQVLVFHELGHCILDRGHKEEKVNGVPTSIMYPINMTKYYIDHEDYYIHELFYDN